MKAIWVGRRTGRGHRAADLHDGGLRARPAVRVRHPPQHRGTRVILAMAQDEVLGIARVELAA